LEGFTFDQFGKGAAGSDGAAAAEGMKLDVGYASILIELEHKLQGIAAGQRADFSHTVGIFNGSDVTGVEEMIFNLIAIVPHILYTILVFRSPPRSNPRLFILCPSPPTGNKHST